MQENIGCMHDILHHTYIIHSHTDTEIQQQQRNQAKNEKKFISFFSVFVPYMLNVLVLLLLP